MYFMADCEVCGLDTCIGKHIAAKSRFVRICKVMYVFHGRPPTTMHTDWMRRYLKTLQSCVDL